MQIAFRIGAVGHQVRQQRMKRVPVAHQIRIFPVSETALSFFFRHIRYPLSKQQYYSAMYKEKKVIFWLNTGIKAEKRAHNRREVN